MFASELAYSATEARGQSLSNLLVDTVRARTSCGWGVTFFTSMHPMVRACMQLCVYSTAIECQTKENNP